MSRTALTLKAFGARISGPGRAARNRLWARGASSRGPQPQVSETLPDLLPVGEAEWGLALVAGRWPALGQDFAIADGGMWATQVSDPRLEIARHAFDWLDDLAALGSRSARVTAQVWVQDWVRRFGSGRGPGWKPEIAGLRAMRWVAHSELLTRGLEPAAANQFWQGLAGHQHYLARAWPKARAGPAQIRALVGLIWSGRVLPHENHEAAIEALGQVAESLIGSHGGLASRNPEALAEIVIALIWTARMLEDAGQAASPAHLAAVGRSVPVLRQIRLGNGGLGRFHGGGRGDTDGLDQALAELRLGVQPKPHLPMGYARLSGGRSVLIMDAAAPPREDAAFSAHAGSLAFEFGTGRQLLVVNAGPGASVATRWTTPSRETSAHSTIEIDGMSSASFETRGIAARTFGARMIGGPTLVTVRQAKDASGMWLLATQDGYVASHGLLHERRLFISARGRDLRGEDILTVTNARSRARFDAQAARNSYGAVRIAARFHLHPLIAVEHDFARQQVLLTLPSGEIWGFRAAGGDIEIGTAVFYDRGVAKPIPTKQVVVRSEAVEYLGQITWSFNRLAEAQQERPETDA